MALRKYIKIPKNEVLENFKEFEICTLKTDLIVEDAYLRISNLYYTNSEKPLCKFNVEWASYGLKNKRETTYIFPEEYEFEIDFESKKPILKQAYEYLKTLDFFVNAENC